MILLPLTALSQVRAATQWGSERQTPSQDQYFSGSRLNVADMATYMLNCLYQIHVALSVYEFTDIKLETIATQMDTHTSSLINEQVNFILQRSGLGTIYTPIINEKGSQTPLSSVSGLDPQAIRTSMTKFGQYLSNPDSFNMPQLELLRSTRVRDSVRCGSVDIIVDVYTNIHKEVTSEKNGYENPLQLVNRTPDEVKLLLT